MKLKTPLVISIALFLTTFLFIGCRKNISAGKNIKVSGFVIDSVKIKKLPNVAVYLTGAHATFYGVTYDITPLDSAITDNNGNFSINYTTDGTQPAYALSVANYFNGPSSRTVNYVVDINRPFFPVTYNVVQTGVAVRARELNVAKLSLKVLSNPYDTLTFDARSYYGEVSQRYLLVGKTIDTTISVRCLPNSINYFQYQIGTLRLLDSAKNLFIRRTTDSINVGFNDTLLPTKTFRSSYDIPFVAY